MRDDHCCSVFASATLGVAVTAEGIESAAQAALVRTFRCDRAQGYPYARPLPAATVGQLLATPAPRAVALLPGRRAAPVRVT